MRLLRPVWICIGACSLLGGCDYAYTPCELLISNGGMVAAKNVFILTRNGDRVALGDLEAGKTVRFSGRLRGEGSANISYVVNGKQITHEGCYYTGGPPLDGTITLKGEKVEYRC